MTEHAFELKRVDIPNVPGTRSGKTRAISDIDTAIFHRIHVGNPESDDAAAIAKFFMDEGKKWIGTHHMPYPFIIPRAQPSGRLVLVEQCVPLWAVTPHAKAWNTRAVGIGVVGDFRKQAPTAKQKAACLWLAQRLADVCTPHLKLRRTATKKNFLVTVHGALTTATSDPEKLIGGKEECPGPMFLPAWREIRKALATSDTIWI